MGPIYTATYFGALLCPFPPDTAGVESLNHIRMVRPLGNLNLPETDA